VSPRILVVFGTRPEAIKLFPVINELRRHSAASIRVCVTAQHRQMLDQVLDISGIKPEIDLDIMRDDQSLEDVTARMLIGLGAALDRERPDHIVVQGDTASAMVASLAGYYRKIPIAHVEAGLRSGDIYAPWPEEVNRKIIGTIARHHFAPTSRAADALLAEGIPSDRVFVTGNTVIDALLATKAKIDDEPIRVAEVAQICQRFANKHLVLVTCHRRESFGDGMQQIAQALWDIADRGDCGIVLPLHPNPNVRQVMETKLGNHPAIALVEPLDYPCFVHVMSRAHIVITDSGGVQEEAPTFGKPVLVMRTTTERPEGVEAETARLVGADHRRIVSEASKLLDDADAYAVMSKAHNPFGDGLASQRIARILLNEA
jgi:UDP-N-acetylglucosamine 2-epimerase (non-hydrolysing)